MKKIAVIFLLLLSCSAIANNSDLDAIYNNHTETLRNFRIGMTSKEASITRAIFQDQSGYEEVRQETITRIILRVDKDKVYEFVKKVWPNTGAPDGVYTIVRLLDYKDFFQTSQDLSNLNFSNIIDNEGIVSFDFSGFSQIDGRKDIFSGSSTKDLLSPMFCGFYIETARTSEGQGEIVKSHSMLSSICKSDTSIKDIKKINLRGIYFCDRTQADFKCETRDMSFLTSNL